MSLESYAAALKNLLSGFNTEYDYIIIDCPPSLNILTVNALSASSGVLIPVQCEFFALQGLSELITTIDTIKNSSNTGLIIKGIIRTMFDPRNNLATDVSAQLLKFFDDKGQKISDELDVPFYLNFEEIINKVDAVSIAVPTVQHY